MLTFHRAYTYGGLQRHDTLVTNDLVFVHHIFGVRIDIERAIMPRTVRDYESNSVVQKNDGR